MKICAYLHASRCLEPCGGVGRHANSLLRRISQRQGISVSTLFSRSLIGPDGQLPDNFPLRDLPANYLPGPELMLERAMRLIGLPHLDWFGPEADWYYSPMESTMPARRVRTAMTLHDVAIFETDLPWSRSPEHLRAQKTGGMWVPSALRRVERILTVSEFSKERITAIFGTDPEKVFVVGNGVEDIFFRAGDEAIGNVEKFNEVVVLGGLRYKKGADHVLAVADALHKRASPVQIVAIGQNEPSYEKKAKDHPNISILGMVSDDVLVKRIVRARAVLLLSHYEGFGIPPLEAMACGTVGVVSNAAALPEVVGDAGLIFQPERTDEIAAALEQLCSDDVWYADLVRKGRVHAEAYTWEHCTNRLLAALS